MNRSFVTGIGVAFWMGGLLGLGGFAPAGNAQCMKWSLRTEVGTPGMQVRHCMAYHADRQRVVLFTSDDTSDLWEYDGTQWRRVFVVGPRPSPRLDSALAYDRLRQELILVGGFGRAENTELADTWTCRVATDATGNALGTWTRRADFPDRFVPDPANPGGELGETGARAEHTLVFDTQAGVIRLFGGKARITRGVQTQSPYNLENYSTGSGAWNGSAWIQREWQDSRLVPQPDPDHPPLSDGFRYREELGRKLAAAAFDSSRGRTITYGGLRQIHQARYGVFGEPGGLKHDTYIEALPHLQYLSGGRTFPDPAYYLLAHSAGRCDVADRNRVFGAGLVHDLRRDRYVAFGGAYVHGIAFNGSDICAPFENVGSSTYASRLLPDGQAFTEWDPRQPTTPDAPDNVQLRAYRPGTDPSLPPAPVSRIGHTMVYDELRGVTVVYGGWDGTFSSLNGLARETWEYAPDLLDFLQQPAPRSELCLGDTLSLSVTPLSRTPPNYQWFHDRRPLDGETRPHLVLPNVTRAHAGQYTCRLADACGNWTDSAPAVVAVGGPPVVTVQPVSQHVCPGETAETGVAFTSDYPATIQWYEVLVDSQGNAHAVNAGAVPGATGDRLRFESMSPVQNGFYRARIANACGTAWSKAVPITAGVWLRVEPRDTTNEVCAVTSLGVIASGKGPLRYQWRRNSEPMTNAARLPGTDTALLSFTTLRYLDDAAYDCIVRDDCNSLTTRVAQVTVIPNPPFLLVATNGPAARERHRMVYDSARGVSVLFGGLGAGTSIADVYRNDTWEYDGTNWTQRFPATSPSPRVDFGLAYDRQRQRVVLFGGATNNAFAGNLHNDETWEYDGTNWTQRFPSASPPARINAALFYDPVRRVTTLYGGDTTLPNPRQGDVWTWDGTQWTPKPVTGSRPLFGGLYGSPVRPQMVWDDARGYAVLPPTVANDPGSTRRVTWTWDGEGWTPREHEFAGFGLTPAQAGGGGGLVYDAYRKEVIYWGGDAYDQTWLWRWNGTTWRRDDLAEQVGYRLDAASSYDTRRNSVVQFGGNYSGADPTIRGVRAWTYERVLADEPVLLRQPVVHDDPATNQLFLRIVAAGAPPLAYEWQRDGVKLNEGFPYTGTFTDRLAVARALTDDAGRYRCVVRGKCGETVSRAITLAGVLEGAELVLTLTSMPVAGQPGLSLSWSGASVALEQAPTPLGPWTTVAGATSPYAPALSGSAFFRLSLDLPR